MATIAQPQTLVRPASTSSSSESGLWSWLTTIDHKRIGILYGVSAIVFLFIGGLEAMLIPAPAGPAREQPAQSRHL